MVWGRDPFSVFFSIWQNICSTQTIHSFFLCYHCKIPNFLISMIFFFFWILSSVVLVHLFNPVRTLLSSLLWFHNISRGKLPSLLIFLLDHVSAIPSPLPSHINLEPWKSLLAFLLECIEAIDQFGKTWYQDNMG